MPHRPDSAISATQPQPIPKPWSLTPNVNCNPNPNYGRTSNSLLSLHLSVYALTIAFTLLTETSIVFSRYSHSYRLQTKQLEIILVNCNKPKTNLAISEGKNAFMFNQLTCCYSFTITITNMYYRKKN